MAMAFPGLAACFTYECAGECYDAGGNCARRAIVDEATQGSEAAEVVLLEHLKRHAIGADAFFLVPAFFLYVGGMALVLWDISRREAETGVALVLNPVGLLLILVGLVFVLVAAFTLRTNYSSSLVIRKDHELVVHGIYRVVRHPIYLGAILVTLGVPIATSSWIALAPMLLLIPLFVYRMRIEERLLAQEFGDGYRAYVARTKRLIPFLY